MMRPVKDRAVTLDALSIKMIRAPSNLPRIEMGAAIAGPALMIVAGRTRSRTCRDSTPASIVRKTEFVVLVFFPLGRVNLCIGPGYLVRLAERLSSLDMT